jgi:hypothetical protein
MTAGARQVGCKPAHTLELLTRVTIRSDVPHAPSTIHAMTMTVALVGKQRDVRIARDLKALMEGEHSKVLRMEQRLDSVDAQTLRCALPMPADFLIVDGHGSWDKEQPILAKEFSLHFG